MEVGARFFFVAQRDVAFFPGAFGLFFLQDQDLAAASYIFTFYEFN